ncbi:Hypothetical protein PHPALM_6224 [Phytophthora palmivora]|uniref:Uncharacterized protein n=1 Tax=Phytophthora palmivora TaxID=4796 RepID=A0A2P4YFE9_9STRA|nr:Hypothetical protein PHPALM_6224 [Phytophthora palmivora]
MAVKRIGHLNVDLDKGRFYRVFLSIGCLVVTQDNWVPIIECDGTHMKRKQREAQKRLKDRGFTINLKFCALHIFFNVCEHFRAIAPAIDSIRVLIFRLQASSSLAEYDEVLEEIGERFPYMLATLHMNSPRKTTSGAYRYFHASFTTAAYVQAVQPHSIHLHILQALMSDPRIQPPPPYNQAGRKSHWVQRDVVMREKRIPSRGETKIPQNRKEKQNQQPR